MPLWAKIYVGFILIGGVAGLFYYKNKGVYFIVGEFFSLLFTIMIFLYYYRLYPRPDSLVIPIIMFCYIIYWEVVENMKFFKEDLEIEPLSQIEQKIMIFVMTTFLLPFIYISIKLFGEYYQ